MYMRKVEFCPRADRPREHVRNNNFVSDFPGAYKSPLPSPDDVVGIWHLQNPWPTTGNAVSIVWLEEGNDKAGLEHIMMPA